MKEEINACIIISTLVFFGCALAMCLFVEIYGADAFIEMVASKIVQ